LNHPVLAEFIVCVYCRGCCCYVVL